MAKDDPQIRVRIEEAALEFLDSMCESQHRSRDWHVNRLLLSWRRNTIRARQRTQARREARVARSERAEA